MYIRRFKDSRSLGFLIEGAGLGFKFSAVGLLLLESSLKKSA